MWVGAIELSAAMPVSLVNGTYAVTLTSVDNVHRAGFQTDQTKERWRLNGYNAAGELVYTSPFIADLPDADTRIVQLVDSAASLIGVTHLRAEHLGDGRAPDGSYTPNSIDAVCVQLELIERADPPPDLVVEVEDEIEVVRDEESTNDTA